MIEKERKMIALSEGDVKELTDRDVLIVLEKGMSMRGTFGDIKYPSPTYDGRLLLKNVYLQSKTGDSVKSFSSVYIDLARIVYIQIIPFVEPVKLITN